MPGPSCRLLGRAILCACLATYSGALAFADHYDVLANSSTVKHRPRPEASRLLKEDVLFQCASQTYLWALPLLNTLGMRVGSEKQFGAGYNVVPVWKKSTSGSLVNDGVTLLYRGTTRD